MGRRRFWIPDDTYYRGDRPVFHVALTWAWTFDNIDTTGLIKLLTIAWVAGLLCALVWRLRPRSPLDAPAAGVAGSY